MSVLNSYQHRKDEKRTFKTPDEFRRLLFLRNPKNGHLNLLNFERVQNFRAKMSVRFSYQYCTSGNRTRKTMLLTRYVTLLKNEKEN